MANGSWVFKSRFTNLFMARKVTGGGRLPSSGITCHGEALIVDYLLAGREDYNFKMKL